MADISDILRTMQMQQASMPQQGGQPIAGGRILGGLLPGDVQMQNFTIQSLGPLGGQGAQGAGVFAAFLKGGARNGQPSFLQKLAANIREGLTEVGKGGDAVISNGRAAADSYLAQAATSAAQSMASAGVQVGFDNRGSGLTAAANFIDDSRSR